MFLYSHLSVSMKYAKKRLLYIFSTFMTVKANLQTAVACQVAGGALSNVDNTKVGRFFFNK